MPADRRSNAPSGLQPEQARDVEGAEDMWDDPGLASHPLERESERREDSPALQGPATTLYPEPFDYEAQRQAWAEIRPASPAPEDEEPYDPKRHLRPQPLWDPPQPEETNTRVDFYRVCLNYEADMAKIHREMRRPEIALARRELDIPPAPPRPKMPIDDVFRKWFEPLYRHNEAPSQRKMPKIPGYSTFRQWYDDLCKYAKAMQVWVLNRRDEYFRCKFLIQAKEIAVRQQQNAPDPFDYIKALVPTALPSAVYKSDPSAPPLLRHHHWWTYARIAAPGPSGSYYLIQSNVDYVPPPPPACYRRLRINGFYGPHELLRYAQWHVIGMYHLAFILTCRDGLVHNALVKVLKSSNIELYEVQIYLDFEDLGDKRYRIRPALFRTLNAAYTDIVAARDAMNLPTWTLLNRPHEPETIFLRGMKYLAEQRVTERDTVETTAALQRCIGELRAWNRYMEVRKKVETHMARVKRIIAMGADLRIERYRQYTRGVFTEDEYVAKLYAQYGVPVFFVQHMRSKYWVPDPRCEEVSVQALHCETRAYDDDRSLSAFAPLQEYAPPRDPPARPPIRMGAPPVIAAVLPPPHANSTAGPSSQTAPDIDAHASAQDDWDDVFPMQVDNEPSTWSSTTAAPPHAQHPNSAVRASSPTEPAANMPGALPGPTARPHKRKANTGVGKDGKKKKRKKEKKKPTVTLPKAPALRARTLPAWWPEVWTIAQEAVRAFNPRDVERMEMLQADEHWPVPQDQYRALTYASPVVDQFGSKDALPGTISTMFATIVKLYGFLLHAIDSTPVRDLQRWSARWWKEILKHKVHPQMQPAFAERLGLDPQRPAAIVNIADDADPETFDVTIPQSLHGPPRAEATPSANTHGEDSGAPATGRISWAHNYNSDSEDDYGDHDDDIDMTRVASPSAQPPPPKYFVPLGSAIEGPPLSTPGQRYLKEPDGWRFKAKGQARGLDDFIWFLEADGDFDGLEFVEVGAKGRTEHLQKRSTEVWWDYEHGRAFIFTEHPSAREGPLDGERLTQPLRVFQWDGGKRPKYIWNTKTNPLQFRLWRAQDLSQRVHVPSVPLGPVGSRTRCRSKKADFLLDDESYAHFFPTAPRTLPRAPLDPDENEDAAVASSAPGISGAAVAVASPVPVPPAASSASSSTTLARLPIGPPTAKQAAKRAYWQQQGYDDVPNVGAPTPLRDALQPSRDMEFDSLKLSPYEPPADSKNYHWLSNEERAWIVWHIAELDFRLELFTLDDFLRSTYPEYEKLKEQSNIERRKSLCAIWSSESIVPRCENPLVAPCWKDRVTAVLAFAAVVSTWPRVALPEHSAEFDTEEEFVKFEKHVWSAYARTYADYYLREAPVPLHRPDPPSRS